ncbi:MAG: hypothetical protein OSB47_10465 [Pirellulaceae bacterium]|nr:hypothetical protein [Pirellulaceae bacterium]
MLASRHLIGIVSLACCLFLTANLQAQPQATKPVQGTELANFIPTTTTWVVLSPTLPKFNGHNTCLAGIYRTDKTISIYARSDNQHVWDLLQQLDQQLEKHPGIKAYIVIHKPLFKRDRNQSTQVFTTIERLAKARKFKHVDVSLSRSHDGRSKLFDDQTQLRFVYSEQRIVKISQDFDKVDQPLEKVMSLVDKTLKLATAN